MTISLLGYLPKKRTQAPAWLEGGQVEELCSVSTCIASAPDGWIDRWVHNDWGFCNSIEAALSLVPTGEVVYDLFAFALSSTRFSDGSPALAAIDRPLYEPSFCPVQPAPLPASFLPLGFDAVSNSGIAHFECSPLSCNNMASSVGVNRYCLIDDLALAEQAAARFSREEPEPGDYYVVQVFRQERL